MGLGPIPYSAIRSYADGQGVRSCDEFAYFYDIIRALDAEYLLLANSANKDETKMVPISDVDEQHRMFARLKARAQKR
jgi:hypothetical protein